VLRGATVGPTDVEGWMVELTLIRAGGRTGWKPLDDFVDLGLGNSQGRFVWQEAPDMVGLEGYTTRVEVTTTPLPATAPRFQRLTVAFHGGYVLPYFRERERIQLVRFARALAERQSAELGGLYALCESGTTHHLGSWFLGRSPGEATAALLYFMGAFADPPHLPREVLSTRGDVPLQPAHALVGLLAATEHLQKKDVASLIGNQDGMVASQAAYTSLRFPFVDSNRALRASRGIARVTEFR
jgi:hypothetical protein